MENNYPKQGYTIRGLWNDIIQLIGMEQELFRRIDELELEIKTLSKRLNIAKGVRE